MKYLKLFEAKQNESEIAKICKKYSIKNWTINSDGLVDVDGNVILAERNLVSLPLRFGKINGDFSCRDNDLTSLKGSPYEVTSDFLCQRNNLTSLKGCPKSVGVDFWCYENELTSLEGGPSFVGNDYYCEKNNLQTLKGAPRKIFGFFDCNNNKLTSLQYGPDEVDDFSCWSNKLTSMQFAPESIGGEVIIIPNPINNLPEKYLNEKYLHFIIKEQYDWSLYRKDGSVYLERLEQMIEWGIETGKIK
jgi:hypothetical protein